MATGKIVVKALDMGQEIKDEAVKVAKEALAEHKLERDIAKHVKQTFDKRYSPTWHCIVGKSFGSFVTHETNGFIYFYIDDIAFLLWKSG
ncbi:dynein light chain 1, cytoplasmic, putative [Acanthamoeba castellanii str. Neff]|jgi:dynein light chain LC8-type|uniref:Dynein light chain n=1 Tax=Acanthamoeba castellanii (strain ATCC 30010 / Neff) TaxID=1257118 RepID=L8GLR9_ACACF|nr:dynein light chain 1, cytoplasmic, putative [Acanthamoeba castellanii str. Neff]ELR13653.1 dynein light chain 1, cytoplasmic, putative [Acanthamoeba castellanii str. Neff]